MDKEEKIMVIWWTVTGLLMIGWLIGTMYGLTIVFAELSRTV